MNDFRAQPAGANLLTYLTYVIVLIHVMVDDLLNLFKFEAFMRQSNGPCSCLVYVCRTVSYKLALCLRRALERY